MEDHRNLPDANRLSVLAATILLAYALTPLIQFPEQNLGLQLPGFFLAIELNFSTVVAVLVALLAAAGADWLLQTHPRGAKQGRASHWMLPALTAWVIGVPLTNLQGGLEWWVVFAFGGSLLMLVLVAEYIALDPTDVRHGPASIGLTAVSFALYLVLIIAVRAAGFRLYTLLAAVIPAIFLVSLRTLSLRLGGQWKYTWGLGIALVTGQFAVGLHYLPISPIQFSLMLLGLSYALTSLAGSIVEGRAWQTLWIEPAVMLILIWTLGGVVGS